MTSHTTNQSIAPAEDVISFAVTVNEANLLISAERDLTSEAEDLLAQAAWEIDSFVTTHPKFAVTWSPYDVPADAPPLVAQMAHAAHIAHVGPMAAARGVIAEYVAKGLEHLSPNVYVGYGGDLYLMGDRQRTVPLLAGRSSITGRVGLRIGPGLMPLAICTSLGPERHAHAAGHALATTVLARDGALADAVATALANRVSTEEDVQRALDATRAIHGVLGLAVVHDGRISAWGNIHLAALTE
jgi:ApbE superfamily uncharacterized protein (UPF0280 family)